jgi:hypothetical protein
VEVAVKERLLGVLDRTLTPMGSRLLRQWLLAPLTSRPAIEARLDAVGLLAADPIVREAMRSALDGVRDVERLASKTASARATPRELRALGDSIERLPAVEAVLKQLADQNTGESGNPLGCTHESVGWVRRSRFGNHEDAGRAATAGTRGRAKHPDGSWIPSSMNGVRCAMAVRTG